MFRIDSFTFFIDVWHKLTQHLWNTGFPSWEESFANCLKTDLNGKKKMAPTSGMAM